MDHKRAIGGFVTFCGGTVVNIIQATKPDWFGNHAWILPASFVVLFVGLLLWICQYRWAQRLLGLVKPSPSPPSTSSPDITPGRLNVIEARYGADDGPDTDVLEKYIKPRIRGDAFVGWVGADLFGPFQPVINAPKRLKVKYLFDGKESTVIRHENEMLVLPEDRFLREQIAILEQKDNAEVRRLTTILESIQDITPLDPRVYALFSDARGSTVGTGNEGYITLVNRGKSDALNVCIESLNLTNGYVVKFPKVVEGISPGKEKYAYPEFSDRSQLYKTYDIFHLLSVEYMALGDLSIHELVLPFIISYQDTKLNLHRADCELVFNKDANLRVRQYGQNGSIEVVSTRNHNFKKIAISTLSLSSETGIQIR